MAADPPQAPARLEASFDADVWVEEVGQLDQDAPMRAVAERGRTEIGAPGVPRSELLACRPGGDGTRLALCVKVYLPLGESPPSERPYAFVFEPAERRDGSVMLRLLAFGERHPAAGERSVYERAHNRRFGRYPEGGESE